MDHFVFSPAYHPLFLGQALALIYMNEWINGFLPTLKENSDKIISLLMQSLKIDREKERGRVEKRDNLK